MNILETKKLAYRFSPTNLVLDDISLQVPQGSIYGFLGVNGAGKTTTLKLILGLLKKQHGEVFILGKSFDKHRVELLKNIGSMIESPSIYNHLTAYENLKIVQHIYQCPNRQIEETLAFVGLSNTGSKKVGQFSLGMKQRLGIAMAIFHRPSLLILDEPSNGLDPNGMIEMRILLKKLNQENGTTIIISSHILAEIEKLVSHIGIINKVQMMFQGTLDELKCQHQQASSIVFDTNLPEKTIDILRQNNLCGILKDGKIIIPNTSKEIIAKITQTLVNEGIEVYEVALNKQDLEHIFMDLINK